MIISFSLLDKFPNSLMIFEKHLTEKTEISKQTKELDVHEITERCILYDKMALCWRKK